jgi:cAMP-dependent protein kinase regulator
MFSSLNPTELNTIIGAVQKVIKKAGDVVIKEGDEGAELFIVEKGELKCTKVLEEGQGPTHLKDYVPGEAFGELALLYNCPRAATIVAKSDSELFSLDRRTFNHIVRDSAQQKRDKYEDFLKTVELLKSLDTYERSKIADALDEKWFDNEEFVIREHDDGNSFYMIMHGTAVATKTVEPGKPAIEVHQYKEGDYFGELALLKNAPRAANIVATSQLQVVVLERKSF